MATGTVLLQASAKVPGAPEMEEGAYTGMGEGGIVGLLEVIESDFARLIADTQEAEATAANEFTTFTNDSAEDKAVRKLMRRTRPVPKRARRATCCRPRRT